MNKKGVDFSMWIVVAVIICLVYLFITLTGKLQHVEWTLGEHEVGLLNTYQKGEELLHYVDGSARLSAWQAVDSFAQDGGMPHQPCGVYNVQIVDARQRTAVKSYSMWNDGSQNCFENANFYEPYGRALNDHLNRYMDKRGLSKDNYEFTVLKDKVIGSAFEPLAVTIWPPPGKVVAYFLFWQVYSADVVRAALGTYYVRPSFTVPMATRLDDYQKVKDKVELLVDCAKTPNLNPRFVHDCIKDFSDADLEWSVQPPVHPIDSVYYFDVKQKQVMNPYTKQRPMIRFALTIAQIAPPSGAAVVAAQTPAGG